MLNVFNNLNNKQLMAAKAYGVCNNENMYVYVAWRGNNAVMAALIMAQLGVCGVTGERKRLMYYYTIIMCEYV